MGKLCAYSSWEIDGFQLKDVSLVIEHIRRWGMPNFLKLFIRKRVKDAEMRLHFFKNRFGGDVVVHGNYLTGNVGDLSIGQVIQRKLIVDFRVSCHLNGCLLLDQDFSHYDLHIVGGGEVIHDLWGGAHNLEARVNPIGSARWSAVLGVGVAGIKSEKGKKLIKKLDRCEFISVRDEGSKEILQPFISKEIEVTACPSFLMALQKDKRACMYKPKSDNGIIGVNLRNWFFPSLPREYVRKDVDFPRQRKRYIKYVRSMLTRLEKEFKLVFIPFCNTDFYFAKDELHGINMKVLLPQSPQKTLETINGFDKMICMRYHSLIFAILTEVPMFLIDYERKTNELANKIKQLNSVLVEDLNRAVTFDVKTSELKRIKAEMRCRAQRNFAKSKFVFLEGK